jgi:hypothetical protein
LPNSGTETKELHGAHHPPVRDVSETEGEREAKELHGEYHPPVVIRFGAEPLVAIGQGRMELRFRVVGALVGFKYWIVLQEADILVHRVIQQQEISFSPTEDLASNEITAELDIMYVRHYKTNHIRFAIGVWDAHEGLREDEALIARKDATFPLLKCEHALTTDNLCRLVNRANIVLHSGMREPDHEPPKTPSVFVFLFLPSCEVSKDPEVCLQGVQRLSPVLKNAYEVRVLVALFMEREVADRIRTAMGCSRVSFIHPQQRMDRILSPVGGAIVLMSDDLKYPIDYLDRASKLVRGAAQSIRGNFVIGQEGYVLSEAAMGSKLSSEDDCQDDSELNGKWVHVLRLGTIALPALSDHDYFFNSLLSQILKIIFNYRPHMRHVVFAHLAEVNDVPLLMIISPSSTTFDSGESPSQWQLQDWQPDAVFPVLASDFGVLPHWNLLANRHFTWQPNSSAWIGWLQKSYRNAAFSSQLANVPILSQKLNAIGSECDESILNIPVAVMSQPQNPERRNHILRLLNTVGFRNVSFPETMNWSDINIEQMTVRGALSTSFFRRIQRQNDTNFVGYLRYTANAVSQVQRISAAAAAKEPIIIMEDDLMLGASVQTIQDILCSSLALKNLPPSADMIYLEYCLEKCDELAYNDNHPNLARAVRPSCSAAILFTVKGAQRVADLCWPVFDVIDRMYPSLIRAGWLEAYILTPPVFYQDGFFRSNLERMKTHGADHNGAGRYHSPHSKNHPPCWEARQKHAVSGILNLAHVFDERFRDFDLDWRQIGVVIPGAEVRSILGMLEGGNRVNEVCRYGGLETTMDLTGKERRSFVWLKYGMPASWTGLSCPGAQIIFRVLRGSSDEDGIPIGSWDTASSCGALLDLDVDNNCAGWQSGEACRLEASLVSVDGVFDDALRFVRFSIFLVDMKADKSGAVLQDPLYRVPKERQEVEVRGHEQASTKASGTSKSMSGMVIQTLRRFLGRFQQQEPEVERDIESEIEMKSQSVRHKPGERSHFDHGWDDLLTGPLTGPPTLPPAAAAPAPPAPPLAPPPSPTPTALPNSSTETKELHVEYHSPVRDMSEREGVCETKSETNELHGEHHPPVAIRFGAEPLVAIGQGRMELRFRVVGALIGFKYRIVLQEADILAHRVIQQQEISFSLIDDSASNEITAELAIMDSTKTELIRFAIGVWDAHAGLREDEALVARKDATFPLLKREHALTTDNAAEWYGAGPPTPPPAAAESAYGDAVCVLNRLRCTETNDLHGEHHPPVAIRLGAEPLVAIGQGRMKLRFRVVGALIGFKYKIVLQEVDILVHPGEARVIQQQEISFSLIDDSASNEITAELVEFDGTKTELIRFAIGVWDAHAGLSEEEALVARYDATFPRLKSEVQILKSKSIVALCSKISCPLTFSESVTVPRRNVGQVGPRLCIAFIHHQRDACHCGESRQELGLLVFSCALGWTILSDLLCAEPYRTRNTATVCCANPGPLLSKPWPRLKGVGSVRLRRCACRTFSCQHSAPQCCGGCSYGSRPLC